MTPNVYYTLTERGKAKAVIMSAEEFESWHETLEINHLFPGIEKDVARAQVDFKAGKVVSLTEIKKKFQ